MCRAIGTLLRLMRLSETCNQRFIQLNSLPVMFKIQIYVTRSNFILFHLNITSSASIRVVNHLMLVHDVNVRTRFGKCSEPEMKNLSFWHPAASWLPSALTQLLSVFGVTLFEL